MAFSHALELPSESGAEVDAALFARPALDAEVGGGVRAHLGFPAEFDTRGDTLERRRRRGVAHAACAMIGRACIAAKLILYGGTDDERAALLRMHPTCARAQDVAVHGGEAVAVARGERCVCAVLSRVEVADVDLLLAAVLHRRTLSHAEMCADVVRTRIVGRMPRGAAHIESCTVVHV